MLVIFDCDGVLVDSEKLGARVFSDTLADYGFAMSADACFQQFKGWTLMACYQWLSTRISGGLPEGFAAALSLNTEQVFKRELRTVKGIEHVLEQLKTAARSYCVATNGGHKKINNSLAASGLDELMPRAVRFSAEDVARGKPDPALFCYAAESMGVPASFCWVVEDSFAGAQAAVAANMSLIFFCEDGVLPDEVAKLEPAHVVSSMRELGLLFETLEPANYNNNKSGKEL